MDAGILEQILWHIHNWFDHGTFPVENCTIDGGSLPASVPVPDGAWYRIQGSLLNDGLHRAGDSDLYPETFDGTVTVCAIPKALLDVADRISDWVDANAEAARKAQESPYQSESFGGYTYTLRSDLMAENGSEGLTGWKAKFASDLNPWRKIS